MSTVNDQINVVEYLQLQHKLKTDIPKDVKDLAKGVILLIIDELEETENTWWIKWK